MRNYTVVLPFVCSVSVSVQAETQKQAKQKMWEILDEVESDFTFKDERVFCDEFEYMEKIVEGNYMHASVNEIEIYDDGEVE